MTDRTLLLLALCVALGAVGTLLAIVHHLSHRVATLQRLLVMTSKRLDPVRDSCTLMDLQRTVRN